MKESMTKIAKGAEEEEHDGHEEHEEDHHVVVVHYPDNTSVSLEVEDHADWPENATGWNLTTAALGANNITWNATLGTWGHMVTGIGGVEADASWYWSLYVWNETGDHWDVSQVVICGDTGNVTDLKYFDEADRSKLPDGLSEDDVYLVFDENATNYAWDLRHIKDLIGAGHAEGNGLHRDLGLAPAQVPDLRFLSSSK